MRVRSTDQNIPRLQSTAFRNLRPRLLHDAPRDKKKIQAHQRHRLLPIIKDGGSHLARIVDARGEGLAIATRHFHSHLRRDVPLRETHFHRTLRRRRSHRENQT